MSKEDTQKVGNPRIDDRPSVRELDGRSQSQVMADAISSVNKVAVRDPDGKIKQMWPSHRDPEPPHKMIMTEMRFTEVEVPHEEVVFFTHGVIMDRNSVHSDSVVIGSERRGHVFDRTYTYNGKLYHRCAYIPNRVERAGILYKKMINRQTRRPVAVLKKFAGTNDPMYQIIGGQEAEYRDLRRIFERSFIKKNRGDGDDELDNFSYDAIAPIPQEVDG
mgnify:CR=1 FL=1